jgi:hypothetical protein
MTNSNLIVGALLFAFVLFLAANKRLGTYAQILWGSSGGNATASAPPSTGQAVAANANNAATGVVSSASTTASNSATPVINNVVGGASAPSVPGATQSTQLSPTAQLEAAFKQAATQNSTSYASELEAAVSLGGEAFGF